VIFLCLHNRYKTIKIGCYRGKSIWGSTLRELVLIIKKMELKRYNFLEPTINKNIKTLKLKYKIQ